jgi:hypothetical protein
MAILLASANGTEARTPIRLLPDRQAEEFSPLLERDAIGDVDQLPRFLAGAAMVLRDIR